MHADKVMANVSRLARKVQLEKGISLTKAEVIAANRLNERSKPKAMVSA